MLDTFQSTKFSRLKWAVSKVQVTILRSRVQITAPSINYQSTQIPLDLIEHFFERLGLGYTFNAIIFLYHGDLYSHLWIKVTCILGSPLKMSVKAKKKNWHSMFVKISQVSADEEIGKYSKLVEFSTRKRLEIRAWVIGARKPIHLDVKTMFTDSHVNTPLGQCERAYYLSYWGRQKEPATYSWSAAFFKCIATFFLDLFTFLCCNCMHGMNGIRPRRPWCWVQFPSNVTVITWMHMQVTQQSLLHVVSTTGCPKSSFLYFIRL